jgi:hypothetical protein
MRSVRRVVEDIDAELFVFGSAVLWHTPRDLDLLIVYNERSASATDALTARDKLAYELRNLQLPLHICLLSADEAAQTCFVDEEKCRLVVQSTSRKDRSTIRH